MHDDGRSARRRGRRRGAALGLAAIIALSGLGLGGCASWFGDSDKTGESAGAERVPGEQAGYPNLATVPARPEPGTTPAERRELARGLVADRARAQYTDQELRGRQPAAVAPPPPAPPAAVNAPAPTPALPSPPAGSERAMPSTALPPSGPAVSAPAMTGGSSPAAQVTASPPPAPPPPPASGYSASQPIPQIVRRAETPAPPMYAGQPPSVAASDDGRPKPPYPPLGPSAAAAPARTEPFMRQPMAGTAAPTQVPTVGLPVTQEQATLEQTFTNSLAQQSSNTVGGAALPPVSMSAAGPAGAGALRQVPGLVNGTPAVIVTFGHGITRLDAGAKQQLGEFAAQAKQHPGVVRVVGHSSRRAGTKSDARDLTSNFNVSVDRANAVARELVDLGVDPAQLKVEAVGASMPRAPETLPSGEAENRRVEVYLE